MNVSDLTVSTRIARWALDAFTNRHVPADVLAIGRIQLADTVAVCLAGSTEPGVWALRKSLTQSGAVLSMRDLALLVGTASHALDYDNVQIPSLVHPSCFAVPTVLIAGRQTHSSATEILCALVITQEVSLWLGDTTVVGKNSRLFERGFHPTAVCGPVGAAVGAGLLLGLNETELAHAINIACSMASGILEGNRTGGEVKPMHAGLCASSGIFAAELAQSGMTGPPTSVEGRFGFIHAFVGEDAIINVATLEAQSVWRTRGVVLKPYPTNAFTHTATDCAIDLRGKGVKIAQLSHVEVRVAKPILRTIAEPRQEKIKPRTAYLSRFSGPFTFAMAVRGGGGLGLSLTDFSHSILADQELLSAVEKVEFIEDAECTDAFPSRIICKVVATLQDGTRVEARRDVNRGSESDPLSLDELYRKYSDCTVNRLNETEILDLWNLMLTFGEGMETAGNELWEILQKYVVFNPESVGADRQV